MPKNALVKTNERYCTVFFKFQKVKNEVFKDGLDDKFFEGFFVENLKIGSRVIIKTKKGYSAKYSTKGSDIIVTTYKTVHKNREKQLSNKKVPSNLIALPFYLSGSIFIKRQNQTAESYDERLFFTGVKMFANKNYNMAVEFFKEIINKHPQSKFYVSSYFLLGDCYKNTKEYSKAIEIYRKAISLSPKNSIVAQTLLSIADIWISKKYYSKARDIYKSVIKDYSTTDWGNTAKFLLAKSFYDQGRYNKAEGLFVEADKKSKFYALSFLLAGECFIKDKDEARAILAYYTMSKRLKDIDIDKYHNELIDMAKTLCKFNDFKAAKDIFGYVQSSDNQDVVEMSYLGEMECDIAKGDLKDLNKKADYIIHNSKNKKRIKEAQKLLDKAKLKSGNINKKTIDKIMEKYKKQPDIISLALYVFAKKNYNDKNYKEAIDYLSQLKKLYPSSSYNKDAKPIVNDSIDKLLDDFYKNPNRERLDYIKDAVILLNGYEADMCRLAVGLIVFDEVDSLSKFLPYAKNQNCKKALYAKYYIEKGFDKNALESLNDVDKTEPYIYYIDMVMGDINLFKGSFDSSVEFYKKSIQINIPILKDYLKVKLANALMNAGKYTDSLNYLNVKLRIFKDKIGYIKGIDYYNLKKYKKAIAIFKQLTNIGLAYKEKSLFYIAISYIKLKDKENAQKYFDKLKKEYPSSEYLKTLRVLLQ